MLRKLSNRPPPADCTLAPNDDSGRNGGGTDGCCEPNSGILRKDIGGRTEKKGVGGGGGGKHSGDGRNGGGGGRNGGSDVNSRRSKAIPPPPLNLGLADFNSEMCRTMLGLVLAREQDQVVRICQRIRTKVHVETIRRYSRRIGGHCRRAGKNINIKN